VLSRSKKAVENSGTSAKTLIQEDFWSAHPCGGGGSFAQQAALRYAREPWIRPLLKELAAKHVRILEIGCGQGVDGYFIAASMAAGASYLGIDYSAESIRTAKSMCVDAIEQLKLSRHPEFRVGTALALDLPDDRFDCVYSVGVIHHTPSPQTCVDEVFRVLVPGGTTYIALYRKYSPKVAVARCLRQMQHAVDTLTSQDRCFYRQIQKYGRSSPSGTMFLECFGVPHMEWYSRQQILQLFAKYEVIDLRPVGYNLFRPASERDEGNRLGFMWLIEARKPTIAGRNFEVM
jgi:ubiquinone/menaquinone biosynthesis C-methylase UbiE